MIIKLLNYKPIVEKSRAGKDLDKTLISGTKMDGSSYERSFFTNNSDLSNALANFGAGEYIKLSYDKSKWKNIVAIEAATKSEVEEAKEYYTKKSGDSSRQGGGANVRRADGTSRGDDTNRSAAIYLAERLVSPEGSMAGMNLYKVANDVFAYITKGEVPESEFDGGDDGLDAPDV